MDLTPPLTGSPASPPNSYCPSERSSLGYPSPDLVAQQYKISSIYGANPPCSVVPQMDSETSLPPLDAMDQTDWHHSSTSAAMPSILSSDYDPFESYDSSLPAAYPHDVYPSHPSQDASLAGTPPPGAHSRSPVPPTARTLSYASGPAISHPLTPRVKLEA